MDPLYAAADTGHMKVVQYLTEELITADLCSHAPRTSTKVLGSVRDAYKKKRQCTIARRRVKEMRGPSQELTACRKLNQRETPYAAQHTVNWRRGEDPCSSYTSLCVSHTVTQQSRKITSQPVNEKRHNNSSKMHCIRSSVVTLWSTLSPTTEVVPMSTCSPLPYWLPP